MTFNGTSLVATTIRIQYLNHKDYYDRRIREGIRMQKTRYHVKYAAAGMCAAGGFDYDGDVYPLNTFTTKQFMTKCVNVWKYYKRISTKKRRVKKPWM